MKLVKLSFFLVFILGQKDLIGSVRFYQGDADQVDREEVLSNEYYNDLNSYRYSLLSEQKWQYALSGLRLSAGSLNKTRFFYTDELKFHSKTQTPWFLNIERAKIQDEQVDLQFETIAIGYRLAKWLHLAALASGDSYKKWGDLGATLALYQEANSGQNALSFTYWSVDHFYNSKEDLPLDRYDHRPQDYQVDVLVFLQKDLSLSVNYEHNTAFRWFRYSKDYFYDYEQEAGQLVLHQQLDPEQSLQFTYSQSKKFEAKTWLVNQLPSEFKKSLVKSVTNYELSWNRQVVAEKPVDSQSISLGAFERHGDYTYSTTDWNTQGLNGLIEPHSFDSRRHEPYFILTRENALNGAENLFFQYGLQGNWVSLRDQKKENALQLKVQTALEFYIEKNSSAFLNVSWDVDQLVHDYPYRERTFKPWGGGNFQINITFD